MEKESIELILQHFDKLAEKIGIGADKIWPWFIRQEYIDSVIALVSCAVSSILFFSCILYAIKHRYPNDNHYSICNRNHETMWTLFLFVTGLIWIVTVIAFFAEGFDFLNAELHAFKTIISTIK